MIYHDISGLEYRYTTLATDSRAIFRPKSTLFAALSTDVADGHDYIAGLYKKGVHAFLVSRIPDAPPADADFYLVDDVAAAIRTLAARRISKLSRGIIVTGSHGKTTCKELLYCALTDLCPVVASPRSWNSGIGVPMSLWAMTEKEAGADTVFITEAAIDAPNQGDIIADTLGATHPIGLITPLSEEHDTAFATHADKVREKARILRNCTTILYAEGDAELPDILRECVPAATLYPVSKGDHPTIYHALVAKVLDVLGLQNDGLDELPLLNKRRQISNESFRNTIIRDYFTPDLRSLRDALDFFGRHCVEERPKVLVLGELLDSGDVYTEAQSIAQQAGIDRLILVNADTNLRALLADYHSGKLLADSQVLIFGKQTKALKSFAEALESASHDTTLEVDLDALQHNYNYYRSLVRPGTGIIAMVKASAYGLGALEIGKTLQSRGASYLAVAVIEEGIALRDGGITMPIMVLNPVTNRYPALFSHKLEPAVFSTDELERLVCEAEAFGTSQYPVHIKLDTGMHRVGFLQEQLKEIARILRTTSAVKVASVFTHLATADCLDMDDYTLSQIRAFEVMCAALDKLLGYQIPRHILNTAGMMRFADATDYNMSRLGIGLYGIAPYNDNKAPLRTVATFSSHIISLKTWPVGTPIGYACRGVTQHTPTVVATVPVGYADGLNRHLGNGKGSMIVHGIECPIIGNVCMDLCMVDVSAVPKVAVGDRVEIFGRQQPIEALAERLSTIPYEVLTSVSPRVKRVYTIN